MTSQSLRRLKISAKMLLSDQGRRSARSIRLPSRGPGLLKYCVLRELHPVRGIDRADSVQSSSALGNGSAALLTHYTLGTARRADRPSKLGPSVTGPEHWSNRFIIREPRPTNLQLLNSFPKWHDWRYKIDPMPSNEHASTKHTRQSLTTGLIAASDLIIVTERSD